MGLVAEYAQLVNGIHAEVDLLVVYQHEHEAAICSPTDQMGVVLAQVQVLKTNELVLVLLEEVLVQDQLVCAVDQLQGAELCIAIKYGGDEP